MTLRILIVEDEPVIALHLEAIITDAGHEVVGIAGNMADALVIANAGRPISLTIMDIDLLHTPDGIETARVLRERYDVGSLFVSAHLTQANVSRAQTVRPMGFVAKPFIEEQILAAIEPYEHEVRELNQTQTDEADAAEVAGFQRGIRAESHAGQCPWTQDGRRDLRRAWLFGFAKGRAAMAA